MERPWAVKLNAKAVAAEIDEVFMTDSASIGDIQIWWENNAVE